MSDDEVTSRDENGPEMREVHEPGAAPSRTNPYLDWSTVLGATLFIVGLIVHGVGSANAAQFGDGLHQDPGTLELAWGSVLLDLGGMLIVGAIVIAGVGWSLQHRSDRD
ncbi:hypothetical protein [Schumannella soli]|uniref:Uncharacterized protein n=1 Tax=Schumannella soli TaxID=2590779 RepID=A0A506XZZ0_9MICO|nr:hypothetical protein [Schumannella soli]TPW75806.1 hypothetical protein FJ657_08055 [Schumannella soli]